ncbi:SIR2 family protein [Vibrio jasicida]|uniref:SIR2 family protein n=1 Tax=Vibrio jasicida TaxID=766224 RepID=UPI000CE43077|nr:SIR2 family protein [Vibrio jasicida]
MNQVKYLSSFVQKTGGIKLPVQIDIDSERKNEDENYQSLLTTINNLLDFDNLIVLAGSGTSLTFSGIAPSMGQLWKKCKEQDLSLFESTLKAVNYDKNQTKRDDTTGDPSEDIELLLSLCEQYIALFPDDPPSTKLKFFLDKCKETILEETNFTDSVKPKNWASHEKFIRTLGRRGSKQQRLKVFTTNYDLAFEYAAGNTGFVVIDGFDFSYPSYFNPAWYRYDITDRSANNSGSFIPNVIHLYKMHGSVNWTRERGRVKKVDYKATIDDPVFIYPSSSKYQASYDAPYLDMMSAFLNSLQQPKTALICLGFGFNDKHINNAVTMALRTNAEINILVATKDPFNEHSSFNKEIRDLLTSAINQGDRRIAIIDGTFEQFSNLLLDRRKETPEEKIFKTFESLAQSINKGERVEF